MYKKYFQNKASFYKFIIITFICLLLICIISFLFWPFIKKLADPVYQKAFNDYIQSLGFMGWLIVLVIQILQVVIAFIPGGPIVVIAGFLYGTWGGLLTSLLGCAIATTIVFAIIRKFGQPLLVKLFGQKTLDNFDFMYNKKRIQTITFILFLIPGLPKDLLTYIASLSPITLKQFLIISLFARAPAILTSTAIGSNIGQGNWFATILLFLLTAAVGIFGIQYKDKIIKHFKQNK